MNSITVRCPAKINLFLEVLGRRDDGFHEVDTVMQSIALEDVMVFKKRSTGVKIRCSEPSVPVDGENLVCRAVKAVSEEMGIPAGVEVEIDKKIPPGSGLGGGSSNAAAAFIALNRLWELGLTAGDMRRFSTKVGTDVSFFTWLANDDLTGFSGGTFIGRGRGNRMRRIKHLPETPVVLAFPPFASCTKHVYSMIGRAGGRKKRDSGSISEAIENGDAGRVADCLFNRLEEVVFNLNPGIRDLKDELLSAGAGGALMTGSGSAVFGLALSSEEAFEIAGRLRSNRREVKTHVTCTS